MFNTSTICILISVVVYLAGMLAIGILYSKNNNSEDFYLGGRKLGPIVTAMSTEASDMSAYLLMGVPGVALFCGVAEASWTAIGLALGTYLNWLIVAKRLRLYSAKLHAITVPDFIAARFRDNTKMIETLGALVIIIFFVPYTASGFSACGKLFNSLFGFDYMTSMLVSAAVIVAYCAMGGFMAASVTSLIQSLVMTFALIVVLFFGINVSGGWDAVVANAKEIPGYLSLTASTSIQATEAGRYTPFMIASTLAWGLGYFGMPQVLLRFMGIRSEKELRLSRRVAIVWVVISMAAAVLIGIVARSVTGLDYLSNSDAENVFIDAATRFLPPVLAGFACAGVLAAAISSSDSYLLISASAVSQNIYRGILKKNATEKQVMWCTRITLTVITLIAMVIAWNSNSTIFGITAFAWAGFGAAFGPLMLFSLFWKRITYPAAIAGMISGGAMVFFWRGVIKPLGGIWGIYELLTAFIFSSLVIVAVSLCTKQTDASIDAEFERVKAGQA